MKHPFWISALPLPSPPVSISSLLSPPPLTIPSIPSVAQLASAPEKPSSVRSVDDFGLNIGSMGHTPLTRKSLDDVSDNVVLKSIKMNGVEIYRSAEV